LTSADAGRTITVPVGTVITVDLAPDAGSYDPPQVDDVAVLREDSRSGGYPDATDARASYTAVTTGTATIASATDLPCLHTTPRCLPPQREFTVTVTVV
jgi:hypothetical protein